MKISGTDNFFLVLNRHLNKFDHQGYECRFILKFDSLLSEQRLRLMCQNSPYLTLLEKTRLHIPYLGSANWKFSNQSLPTKIYSHSSTNDEIPEEVFHRKISLKSTSLFHFDLVHHPQYSSLIFSWHHILLDGFGAQKILHSLANPKLCDKETFMTQEKEAGISEQWKSLIIAKDFLKDISRPPLYSRKLKRPSTKSSFTTITLTSHQKKLYQEAARSCVQSFSATPYFLGSIGRAYVNVLYGGEINEDIWVPVPMEMRKAGATGPIVSNRHSLLFFRIKSDLLHKKSALVKDLNQQLIEQVRNKIHSHYYSMISSLRILPSSFVYQLIKGPNGKNLAGFLFSQSPSPSDLMNFDGLKVEDATAIPPNTSPPGISFQVMSVDDNLKILIRYSHSYFSESEIEKIKIEVEKELLNG